MEATALSVGKSVLDGALGYAKSALAEEVALQLGVQRDHAFIKGELEMMQAFLKAAHDEHDNHEVLMTWVKHVRDVAYDAEDCLQDFSIHLHKPSSWWRLSSTLKVRRRIAKQMKDLRARVEDVSQRNLRYQLIRNAGSKSTTDAKQSSITAATIFSIDEAQRHRAEHDKLRVGLVHLINMEDKDLRVIAVWGTSGDLGLTSIIHTAYENPDIKKKFSCRAWVRISPQFNPNDFIQSIMKQFQSAMGVHVLLETEKTGQQLAEEFTEYINKNSYLIVLNGLFTFEEWNLIRTCFPNNNKGSRIIVCCSNVEVASLCAGQESQLLELKQLSTDQTIYAFYEKDCQDQTKLLMPAFSSDEATTDTNEIQETQSRNGNKKLFTKSLTRIKTMVSAFEESQIIGREKEKVDIIKLLLSSSSQELLAISVWRMGGLGKTTLVKDIYESQALVGIFEKRAFVTVMRPFVLQGFLNSLVMQLNVQSFAKKGALADLGYDNRNTVEMMGVEKLIKELARLLDGKKCLIVLDDLLSMVEWDNIIESFQGFGSSCQIVVTTREEGIAKHCSQKPENIYKLNVLEQKDALDLFTRKVFKKVINVDKHPELIGEAKQILKKCNGLPLAIVTVGGFLANQPKVAAEWRKFNEHISAELEMNPELEPIKTILGRSYEGLPYHLKSCFLYLSIFPEDHKVSRRRLTRRWTAEGYSRDIREKSAEEVADTYFMELINRSMILPSQQSVCSRKGIDSCQVHDLMREISISKSMEESLVFILEEGCTSKPHGIVRHLSISSNWKGDKDEFESMVDLSRVRSLTVFGKFRSFFISDKMRLLRILDMEGTSGLTGHHLTQIAKLFHLKYLSLRGCLQIFYLPDSIGNLRQLQTLDLERTSIIKLPKTITKFTSLQYLRVSNIEEYDGADFFGKVTEGMPKLMQKKGYFLTMLSVAFCVLYCRPQFLKQIMDTDADHNRRDVCTLFCCVCFPVFVRDIFWNGAQIPRGIRKLKALRTMGLVNFTYGKEVIEEIKELSQLRKLAVAGISMKNGQQFCSAVAELSNLESLLVQSSGEPGLQGCLDGLSQPPRKLQSLKLYGNLIKLPEWINGFHNLVKLTLRSSRILDLDATIQVLGKLPNLASLRLWAKSFQGEDICFSFRQETFPSLTVLELKTIDGLKTVEFQEGSMLKLELLDFCGSEESNTGLFSGLQYIPILKVFNLDSKSYKDDFIENLQAQLAENPNGPILRRH